MVRLTRGLFAVLFLCCAAVWGLLWYYDTAMPDQYTVSDGESVNVGEFLSVSSCPVSAEISAAGRAKDDFYTAKLTLLGLFPVKDVTVSVSDRPVVTVLGTPFGIKLYTDGVLIVGMTDVNTAAGAVNPAAAAGIRVGDTIVSVNGKAVWTNREVSAAVNACGGKAVQMLIRRDGVEFTASFVPAHPADEEGYRAGLWVRDSTAGVGTLTFYDAATGMYAGLGHAICDTDTGTVLSLSDGEIVPARIYDVKKSTKGSPGELSGGFEIGTLGKLIHNGTTGLYGPLYRRPTGAETYAIARKQEVHTGPAQMLTTVDGMTPALYTVNIDQVRYNASSASRHMVVRVTDPALLEAAGGIVQGMSGSPLIQDGRLVGAVTHVLVDDPTRGYAIFAENMLETAQGVASENKLKDAS